MAEYTTGEMAKLCNITVRTVQYYDNRSILVPSRISDGGRRLYSDDDLKKLKVICFLRELGLSINSIGEILSEDNPQNVISLLLAQQQQSLRDEITERQTQLDAVEDMIKELKNSEGFSLESITDFAHVSKNKSNLSRIRKNILITGIIIEAIMIALIVIWIVTGFWVPFAISILAELIAAIFLIKYYCENMSFICPECHKIFKGEFLEVFLANHTAKTRKLTCPHCGHKGFCIETYTEEN